MDETFFYDSNLQSVNEGKILKLLMGKSIQFKLSLYFLFIIFLLAIAIGVLSNMIFSNTMEKEVTDHSMQMIQQVNRNLEFNIKKMVGLIDFTSNDAKIIEFLKIKDMNASNRIDVEYDVRKILRSMKDTFPEILGILVVNENDVYLSNEIYRLKREPLINEYWYKQASLNPTEVQLYSSPLGRNLASSLNYTTDDIVSIIKAINDPVTKKCIGVFVIDIKMDTIKTIIQDVKLGKTGFVYIVDLDGNMVFSPFNKIAYRIKSEWLSGIKSDITVQTIKNNNYQIIFSESDYTRWKTVGVSSLNETLNEVVHLRYYSIIIGILTALLAIIMALFFTSSISKPINKLRKLMKSAEDGNLDVKFESQSNDEIGQLGQGFNNMINEIKKLLNLVYIEQKSKREAELKILQSQIKPHFLYNTLDNIQWMAMRYGADDIIDVIGALTTLFRIGLSKGKELIKVSDELEHIKSYLLIQKVRYREKLDYVLYIDDSILNYKVIKITLQPIIENAIYHGVKEKDGNGKIVITAKINDGKLFFTITDDGPGIEPEKLIELNKILEGGEKEGVRTGYGLYNVNERIRLSFGYDYGLKIYSTLGEGTTVEVYHPIIEEG